MKEYKVVSIGADYKNPLDVQLNQYAVKGWYIKDILKKGDNSELGIFIYLLEREVKGGTVQCTQKIPPSPKDRILKEGDNPPLPKSKVIHCGDGTWYEE